MTLHTFTVTTGDLSEKTKNCSSVDFQVFLTWRYVCNKVNGQVILLLFARSTFRPELIWVVWILIICSFCPGPCVFDKCKMNISLYLLVAMWTSTALTTCWLFVSSPILKSPKYAVDNSALYKHARYGCRLKSRYKESIVLSMSPSKSFFIGRIVETTSFCNLHALLNADSKMSFFSTLMLIFAKIALITDM